MTWADEVSEASDGRLMVTVYPGRALGFKDADMLRLLKTGTIEVAMTQPQYTVSDDPLLDIVVMRHGVMLSRDQFPAVVEPTLRILKPLWQK